MALFGVGDYRRAVSKLKSAHRTLQHTAGEAPNAIDAIVSPRISIDVASESELTRSARTFEQAFDVFCASRMDDRERIIQRKCLSVPCMLLFVSAFVKSEDLVPIVDTVLEAVDRFVDDGGGVTPDDTPWLSRRGLVGVLVALFVGVEASRTDDTVASQALACDLIHAAARLATSQARPGRVSTAGDMGAFARLVAKGRPHPPPWCRADDVSAVDFSLLSRARQMQVEAEKLRATPLSRRTGGGVLDAGRRARIADLLKRVNDMCPTEMLGGE
jgi:hypothetical protein